MAIKVYNRELEIHSDDPNNYIIFDRELLLGNPYVIGNPRTSIYHVRSLKESLQRYSGYFDLQYNTNSDFKAIIDDIADKCRNGEDVYLECNCMKHKSYDDNNDDELCCHGQIIKSKIEKMLLFERLKEIKEKRHAKQMV